MEDTILENFKRIDASVDVSEWTRYLIKQEYEPEEFPLYNLSKSIGELLDSNVYIVSNAGEIHGYYESYEVNTQRIKQMLEKKKLPYNYVSRLAKVDQTRLNISIDDDITVFPVERRADFEQAYTSIVPIWISNQKLGYVIIASLKKAIAEDYIYVIEHTASLIGTVLSFESAIYNVLVEQKRQEAYTVVNALSKSEFSAIIGLFDYMDGAKQMTLTTSELADQLGITRSIIVNALQKLVTGYIIRQQSMGMKGTHIEVINPYFIDVLNQY